jgi:hypothetical protein
VGENCMEGGDLIYSLIGPVRQGVGPWARVLGWNGDLFQFLVFSLSFFFFINGLFFLIWSLGFRS